jgi:hypothetical protein
VPHRDHREDCRHQTTPDTAAPEIRKQFRARVPKLGFPGFKFHWTRRSQEAALTDAGVPVSVGAERGGHDPPVLL